MRQPLSHDWRALQAAALEKAKERRGAARQRLAESTARMDEVLSTRMLWAPAPSA
jgi:hypothetical protein